LIVSPGETYLSRPLEAWRTQLHSDDPLRRRLAAYALGEIGPAAARAAPDLEAALDDPVHFVRVWAAAALARVAPANARWLAVLIERLRDEQGFVRSLAAWHLGRIGLEEAADDACLDQVQCLLEDIDPSVRTEAELALWRLRRM
jgi:HEAT repeat protein